MDAAILYYYWSDIPCNVWEDHKNPIILAIASLRHFHRHVPMQVLDVSKHYNEWGDYWLRLNFHVHRRPHALAHIEGRLKTPDGLKLFPYFLARPATVYEHSTTLPHQVFLYSDSDVFWIKPVFPFLGDIGEKLCIRSNGGLFYYSREVQLVHKTFQMWNAYCTHAAVNGPFARMLSKAMQKDEIHDETVLNFIQRQNPQMFSEIPTYENYPFRHLGLPHYDTRKAKNIHVHCCNFKSGFPKKSLACLYIKELRDIVTSSLGEDQMVKIFGDDCEKILPISMYDHERMALLEKGEL